MLKKSICFVLTLIMLSATIISSAQITTEPVFEAALFGEKVKVLMDLKIIPNLSMEGGNQPVAMGRGEFAYIIVRAMNLDPDQQGRFDEKFLDVPKTHKYFQSIMVANKMGLLNGISDTKFNPDDDIYLEQAVSVVVKMINYQEIAQAKGGYPTGYMRVATEKKMLTGLTYINSTEPALRGDIYLLMYNTLNADMIFHDSISEDGDKGYSVYEGRNILSEYHKIFMDEGIVVADNQNALKGIPTQKAGNVVINGREYSSSTDLITGLVGKNIKFFYKEEHNDEFILLSAIEKNNKVISFTPNHIVKFDYLDGVYQINDGGKTNKLVIGERYSLSYNGSAIEGSNFQLMNPAMGTITLIDNNKDDIYDVVIVEEYYNMVFGRYDSYKNIIYDFYYTRITLVYQIGKGGSRNMQKHT